MEPSALWQVCACSGFRNEMGCSSRHCLSTFNFQMALTSKNVFLHTHSLPHSFFFLPLILSRITPMAPFSIWTRFLVQNVQHEVRGKQVRLPERQNGTWAGAMENQVVVGVRPYVCSQTRSVRTDCVTLDGISETACFVSICYSESQSTTYLKHLTHLLFFLRSPNHKNLILGSGPLASTPIAVGIDRRSIPTAGDNHSVSASTDPNSYLGLLTASMAQMTTGPQISLYCSKTPSGHLVGNVSRGPNLNFFNHPLDAYIHLKLTMITWGFVLGFILAEKWQFC